MGVGSSCACGQKSSRQPRNPAWHQLARLTYAAWAPGLLFAVVDAGLRDGSRFRWSEHALGTFVLTAATAGAIGLSLFLYLSLEGLLLRLVAQTGTPMHGACQAGLRGVIAAALVYPTARFTFSGNGVQHSSLATFGPPVMAATIGALAGLCAACVGHFVKTWSEAVGHQRSKSRLRFAVVAAFLTATLLTIDLTVYPFLYGPLHTLVEVTTGLCVLTAALALWPDGGLPVPARARNFLALGSLLTMAALSAPFRLSEAVDGWLAHTWLEELYVGRTVRRLGELKAHLGGQENFDWARRGELLERFDITDTSLDPQWRQPRGLRRQAAMEQVQNIAIFYVDTLREDVTRDPRLMPRLARFREESLDFTQAYAVGSDTLRSLPALTSGTQFIQHESPGDLLALARTSELESTLVSATSAAEFLERLRPEFAFERVQRIADTQPGEAVWGYGATRPTAGRIVDGALTYLQGLSTDQAFFLWLLHFDQHAWRELSDAGIDALSQRLPPAEKGPQEARYRAVAASVDVQFGRFLDGLERLGHESTTAVLFVSDHGEGLGQEGFWVHSVFLWDSLLHVPLVLRIPGVGGRTIDTPVSLVDVAPTLAPMLGAKTAIYHGEDLLGLATAKAARTFGRRFPIVLRSAYSDSLSRIGVIDPDTNRKFVLRLRALFPELYDLTSDPLDQNNLAPAEPKEVNRLLGLLARSPVFPRAPEDYWLLGSQGELRPTELSASAR